MTHFSSYIQVLHQKTGLVVDTPPLCRSACFRPVDRIIRVFSGAINHVQDSTIALHIFEMMFWYPFAIDSANMSSTRARSVKNLQNASSCLTNLNLFKMLTDWVLFFLLLKKFFFNWGKPNTPFSLLTDCLAHRPLSSQTGTFGTFPQKMH